MSPSRKYRSDLRAVRPLLTPDEEAMLLGANLSSLHMRDLEALVELVIQADPRKLAPPDYLPRP